MSTKPQRKYGRKSNVGKYGQGIGPQNTTTSPSHVVKVQPSSDLRESPRTPAGKRKHLPASVDDDELLLSADEDIPVIKRSKYRRKRGSDVSNVEKTVEDFSPESSELSEEDAFVQGSSRLSVVETVQLHGGVQLRERSASSVDPLDTLKGTGTESPKEYSQSPRNAAAAIPEDVSSLTTPRKKPKDLSQIFDSLTPSPFRRRTPGTSSARRMLGRTKTESSIELSHDSPHRPAVNFRSFAETGFGTTSTSNISKPELSKSRDLSRSPSKADASQSQTNVEGGSQSRSLAQVSGRTYAGSSRSFLLAIPTASLTADISDVREQFGEEDELKDSYTDLRMRWGVDNSEPDPLNLQSHLQNRTGSPSPPSNIGLYNPLSSITELRSKGESRRFMDEIGYLFEGLDAKSSIGLSRSSALEMIAKLCDATFMKRAKAAGFVAKAWEVLRGVRAGEGDKILDAALAVFVALIADDARHVHDLSRETDFIAVSVKLLAVAGELDYLWASGDAKARSTLPKLEMSMLLRLRMSYRQVSDDVAMPSIRAKIYEALANDPPLIYPHILHIIENITPNLTFLRDRVDAFSKGLPLISDDKRFLFEHIADCLQHCLQILDAALVNELHESEPVVENVSADVSRPVMSRGLVALVVAVDLDRLEGDPVVHEDIARACKEYALRIFVNLTNENTSLCKDVVADKLLLPALIRMLVASSANFDVLFDGEGIPTEPNSAQTPDTLLLGLALLTNVVQEYKESISWLSKNYYSSSCSSKHRCISGCVCSTDRNAIQCLLSVYQSSQQELPDNEPLRTFLKGHLAVLLGLILTHDNYMQQVLNLLPGTSRKAKLDGLIRDSSDFAKLYTCIAENMSQQIETPASPITTADLNTHTDSDIPRPKQTMIASKVVETLISLRNK